MKQLAILLGDDHQLILNGLRDLLLKTPIVAKVDCATNKAELLAHARRESYNIVFLDIHFGEADGREIGQTLLAEQPALILAALTSFDDAETIRSTINTGFKAYFLKSDALSELVSWIEKNDFNTVYLSNETKTHFTNSSFLQDAKHKAQINLSEREKQVLTLIMAEYTTRKIAEELFLSEKTIENYRSSLMLKLEVTNLTGLVKKTLLLGLLND